jgi:cell wall-associated NlpC family hydrolase
MVGTQQIKTTFNLPVLMLLSFITFLFASCASLTTPALVKATPKIDAETAMREELVNEASRYIGSNYKYGGTSPKTGFDCSGFTSYIFEQFGVSLPHQSGSQAVVGQSISINHVMPGDLVYFSRKGSRIFHVALVEKKDDSGITVIHSTTSRGVIRENITQSNYWKPKIAGARRVVNRDTAMAN